METYTQDCGTCRKSDVCKFKAKKQEAESRVETEFASEPDYSFLQVKLLCNYYDVKLTTSR